MRGNNFYKELGDNFGNDELVADLYLLSNFGL